ncbi:hypothetical protein GCM10023190_23180 [Enteractinococcus fodinae]|uniref:N,N-dimethylformamidase alpha subunit domain-containing protein n=1 Tax=Enteractinococcus fodinae TaxID=684663 RepID=A0ABU2B2U6_9MICC|nr:hypothetical protein [Enteractinococcus fodinae]MDR7347920.1 hypothetical protein [Enteractinococcus fodinae]
MFPIPPPGSEDRERIIEEHKRCIGFMKGIPGNSIVRTESPGSVVGVHGGIHEDKQLAKVLVRMRAQQPGAHGGKLVAICLEPDKAWRIGQLSGIRGVPPKFVDDRIFDNEQDIQHEIFLMRLDQYPERDGMPEHFHEGWKRRDDNWATT